jgi:hypothetical protein
MIWGEVVNSVRNLHLKLHQEFAIDPKLFLKDVEINGLDFPFPEAEDDFDEWQEIELEASIQDIIPLHSVERVLIEGPILPIQKVKFHSKNEIDTLFGSILRMEKEWCEKNKISSPDKILFIENDCTLQALRIAAKAGFNKLAAVRSV